MWDLLFSIKESHLVDGGEIGRHSSMDAKNGPIHNGSKRYEIKGFIEIFPAVRIAILFVYFIKKAIHHGDIPTLVVSSQQKYSIWVFDLQTEKQSYGLNWIIASVDEVSNHDEFAVGDVATDSKHFLDIIKLAVDITSNFDWSINGDDVGLVDENIFDHVAEFSDCRFGDGFALLNLLKPLINVCHE